MRNGGKTLDEMRMLAMQAARSKTREMRIDPQTQTADDMLMILDDLLRAQKQSSKPFAYTWATQ